MVPRSGATELGASVFWDGIAQEGGEGAGGSCCVHRPEAAV